MKQKNKELLLKDLCARLPYDVVVRHANPLFDSNDNETGDFFFRHGYLRSINTLDDISTLIIESEGSCDEGYEHICPLERTLAYLRPMSSMTEEEKKRVQAYLPGSYDNQFFDNENEYIEVLIHNPYVKLYITDFELLIDYLNSRHFDYRGLIKEGLALEAPDGMYT